MTRLQILQGEIMNWSDSTFGDHRTGKPIAHHLKKEVDEVIDAIDVLRFSKGRGEGVDKARTRVQFELADCLILLLDVATHEKITVSELIDASEEKMEINKKRKWGEPDENGVVEHINNKH